MDSDLESAEGQLGLGLGLGNDSAGLILMTRFIKKHIKYLNFKEKYILKIIIHHSKALETKHPKYDHIYTI